MFARVEALNFLSWKALQFEFELGVTLIEGWNKDDQTSEGSGKSAILNALCWGLYGQLPKDAKIDDVVKSGETKCDVIVTLDNNDKICRSRRPNDLYMEINEREVRGRDAKETQKLIEAKVGMSFETFCQSVYFAQNYPNKFITANEADKAKILSELQDLSIFDRASKEAGDRAKLLKSNLQLDEVELDKLNYKNNMLFTQQQRYEELRNQILRDKDSKLSKLNASIAVHLEEMAHMERKLATADIPDVDKLEQQYETALEKKAVAAGLLATAREQEKMLKKANKEQNCPTCRQPLPNLVGSYDQCVLSMPDISKYEADLKEATDIFTKRKTLLDEARATKATLLSLQREINGCKSTIIGLQDEVESVQNQTTLELDSQLEDLKKARAELEADSTKLELKIANNATSVARLDHLRRGFKEVKSYVFQALLVDLQRRTNTYLQELFEHPVSMQIDNSSDDGEISKINIRVAINGEDRPLGLYSGGQFRRIQLAVDLALSDIISARSDKPVKLLILDEYFKDLSENSMERVLFLLQKLQRSVILIEHNSIFKSIISNVVKVELEDGTSRMV